MACNSGSFFAVIGTVNGTNFTDGLDGLASSVTVLVATFFTVVAIGTKSGIEPITCAVVGALMGFLLFNVYPASVFMGDTGSLALGGFVAGTAYMMQMPLYIIIVGFIYLVEVISVILQVTYFKKTGGKRLFKDGTDPSPFRALWMVRDTSSSSIFYRDGNSLPDRSYGGIEE